jgi:hypothetical protein
VNGEWAIGNEQLAIGVIYFQAGEEMKIPKRTASAAKQRE